MTANRYDASLPLPVWPEDRACRDADTELFFSETRRGGAEAKLLCRGCPIVDACLAWALTQASEDLHGVWGGTTNYERRKLRRQAVAA